MSTQTLLSAYGLMLIILLSGMLSKDRKTKYRFRMGGYGYMVFLNIVSVIFQEGVSTKFFYGVLTIFWLYLANKDFKSSKYFDQEFARIDNLENESKERIAKLFWDRRN